MLEIVEAFGTNSMMLSDFCALLLGGLPRSDQRRWGEAYVRGLVELPGRKSIPRIAARLVGDRAGQSLQQFVNQSPWAWEPVRKRLAEIWNQAARPRAWVVEEVALPKAGSNSVGVATQYVAALQRSMHCQIALALFVVGTTTAGPVNWRLTLPHRWTEDPRSRAQGGVPDDERQQDRWQYVFDMLDELIDSWRIPSRPVVLDARDSPTLVELIAGLEKRRLSYLVQVSPGTPPIAVTRTAGRRLVPDLRPGPTARSGWLTNLPGRPDEILGLAGATRVSARAARRLFQDHGLHHFEGRSFRGWHHHVTLVSVAHAFRELPLRLSRADNDLAAWRESA
jgi:hypothetical protein